MRYFKKVLVTLLLTISYTSLAADYDTTPVQGKGGNKGNLPPGCFADKNSTVVNCPNGLTLSYGDTITATELTTIEVTGDANLSNATITGVDIIATGDIIAAGDFMTDSNLTANSGNISFGQNIVVAGTISADTVTHTGGAGNTYQNINVTSQYNGSAGNVIQGALNGGDITTAADETVLGSITGNNVSLGARTRVASSITAVSLETDVDVELQSFVQAQSVTIGSSSLVEGSITGTNSVLLEPAGSVFNGNIDSNGLVDIGTNNQVNGNVTANSVFLRADAARVDGNVVADNELRLESGTEIMGSASANTLILNDANVTIDGDAFADTRIQIGYAGVITGDATSPLIVNNSGNPDAVAGETYCDDSSSNTDPAYPFTCTSLAEAPTDPGDSSSNISTSGDACEDLAALSEFGIVGLDGFQAGTNSEINSNVIAPEEGNTPKPDGSVDTIDLAYPPIDPPSFPDFAVLNQTLTNQKNIAPGTYGTIFTDKTNDYSSTTGGGTYYIDTISFSTNNNYIELGNGTYFVRNMNMGNNSSVIITGGAVKIYILNGVTGGNDISFNSAGATSDLIVYLYEGADFVIGNYCNSQNNCPEFTFNGSIYSPYTTSDIEFGQNTNYQGSALTPGTISFGNNTQITYSEQTQEEVLISQGCDPAILDDSIDHYRLQFAREQISCLAAPVTLQACADANCSSLVNAAATVTVSSSSAASQWFAPGPESTTSGNTVDFSFSDGEAIAELSWAAGGLTTLSIASASPTANNPLQCVDLSGTAISNCQINFKKAGLIITDVDGQSPVPPAYAGEAFNTTLRAVETNSRTGACQGRVQGTRTVQLGVETINPTTPISGETYTVNGNAITLYAAGNGIAGTSVSVTFDSQGYATLNNQYSDVGRLRMLAELNAGPGNSNGNPAFTLTGSSINNYVVKPYTLAFTALNDNGSTHSATLASGSGFKAAGDTFTGQIQSLNKQGNITPNFGNEGVTAKAVYVSTVHPSPASSNSAASQLVGEDTFTPAAAATLQTDLLSWREAGTINIAAQLIDSGGALDNYLGAGDAFQRPPFAVGRFYPHRFELDTSSLSNSCLAFSYMGQPEIGVSYSVSAVNVFGTVTQNYANTGGIIYGGGNTAVLDTVATNTSPLDTATDNFASRWQLTESNDWQLGVLTFSANDAVFNKRSDLSPDGPYANFSVGLQVDSEIDNRSFASSAFTLITPQGDAVPLSSTLELRYGRTQLANISGPQGEDLSIVMQNQYFTSNGLFVTNTDDNCFNYNVNNFDAGTESIVANGTAPFFEDGRLLPNAALFEAPTSPELGIFPFSYDTPVWLEFDWDGDGTEENPSAVANFGYYRGNDRVIYWLERWR